MRIPSVRVLVWLVVVLAAGLAGCTASEDAGGPEPLSAREALEEARPVLEEWNEDTELLVLSGFEGGAESPAIQQAREREDTRDFPVHEDPLPGDGRVPQWVMVVLADGQTRSLRASSEEVVWMDEGGRQASPGARPVGNWTIDSTEAVENAREDSKTLDRIVAAGDASVFLTLGGGSRGTQWQVQANSHQLGEQEVLSVDAISGEVRNRTEMQTTTRSKSFEGQLEPEEANATHTVDVARNGTRIAAELTWNATQNESARLSARLFKQGSQQEPAARQQGSERFTARWEAMRAGSYEVEIQVEDWGSQQAVGYELRIVIG